LQTGDQEFELDVSEDPPNGKMTRLNLDPVTGTGIISLSSVPVGAPARFTQFRGGRDLPAPRPPCAAEPSKPFSFTNFLPKFYESFQLLPGLKTR
jgi:hypothetical protein